MVPVIGDEDAKCVFTQNFSLYEHSTIIYYIYGSSSKTFICPLNIFYVIMMSY